MKVLLEPVSGKMTSDAAQLSAPNPHGLKKSKWNPIWLCDCNLRSVGALAKRPISPELGRRLFCASALPASLRIHVGHGGVEAEFGFQALAEVLLGRLRGWARLGARAACKLRLLQGFTSIQHGVGTATVLYATSRASSSAHSP